MGNFGHTDLSLWTSFLNQKVKEWNAVYSSDVLQYHLSGRFLRDWIILEKTVVQWELGRGTGCGEAHRERGEPGCGWVRGWRGEWENDRRERAQPSSLFSSHLLIPLLGPSNLAYQVTCWRRGWFQGTKFPNWPPFWELIWEGSSLFPRP